MYELKIQDHNCNVYAPKEHVFYKGKFKEKEYKEVECILCSSIQDYEDCWLVTYYDGKLFHNIYYCRPCFHRMGEKYPEIKSILLEYGLTKET